MASPNSPLEQIFAWTTLALGLLAVILFGAWPHLMPTSDGEAPSPNRVVIDAETAQSLRRAGLLIGTGNRIEQLADDPTRLEQAEKIVDELLELHPKLAEAHRLQGLLALRKGELTAAQHAFERCLKLDPPNLPALLALGATHAEQEDHAAAEEIFRRAVKFHPESIAALHNHGQTLWLLGRQDDALEVYRRKIKIQEDSGIMPAAIPPLRPEDLAAEAGEAATADGP